MQALQRPASKYTRSALHPTPRHPNLCGGRILLSAALRAPTQWRASGRGTAASHETRSYRAEWRDLQEHSAALPLAARAVELRAWSRLAWSRLAWSRLAREADSRGADSRGAGQLDADECGAEERGAGERDADERDGLRGRCPATAARQNQ
jgi:hypothetical protein